MTDWIAALVAAVLAAGGAILGTRNRRIRDLEQRVNEVEQKNIALWTWALELVNHIYKGKPPPPPAPPSGLTE